MINSITMCGPPPLGLHVLPKVREDFQGVQKLADNEGPNADAGTKFVLEDGIVHKKECSKI